MTYADRFEMNNIIAPGGWLPALLILPLLIGCQNPRTAEESFLRGNLLLVIM